MKSLINYLKEDGVTTPTNTIGIGNPQLPSENSLGSEPLTPAAKCKKEKCKKKKCLKESILDDEDEVMGDIGKSTIDTIIKKHFLITGPWTIKNKTIDVKGSVYVTDRELGDLTLGNLINFGKVSDMFMCSDLPNLTSLKGAPKKVKHFYCSGNYQLKNLEYAPEIVTAEFNCGSCLNLASLKGAPKKTGNFLTGNCPNLKNLEGITEIINGDLDIRQCDKLSSLKGLEHTSIKYDLRIERCFSLKEFDYLPKTVKRILYAFTKVPDKFKISDKYNFINLIDL